MDDGGFLNHSWDPEGSGGIREVSRRMRMLLMRLCGGAGGSGGRGVTLGVEGTG